MSTKYEAIAASLKASYPSVTAEKVRQVEDAMREKQPLPYGIVGRFIQQALKEADSQ